MYQYRNDRARMVPLTRELLKWFLGLCVFIGERPKKNARILMLKSEHKSGRFDSPVWAVANYGGKQHRSDGQHSSAMLAELTDSDFPFGLNVFIKEYDCQTERDLAELFDRFDKPVSSRTRNESVNAHAKTQPELQSVKPTTAYCCAAGIAWFMREVSGIACDCSVTSGLVHEHPEVIKWMSGCQIDRKPGVYAAMYETWCIDRFGAETFWLSVKNENHPDPKYPTRRLATRLKDCADSREAYAVCIHAWNAQRRGKTTNLNYFKAAPLPKALK